MTPDLSQPIYHQMHQLHDLYLTHHISLGGFAIHFYDWLSAGQPTKFLGLPVYATANVAQGTVDPLHQTLSTLPPKPRHATI